jgi:hypothetical protein
LGWDQWRFPWGPGLHYPQALIGMSRTLFRDSLVLGCSAQREEAQRVMRRFAAPIILQVRVFYFSQITLGQLLTSVQIQQILVLGHTFFH